MNGEMNGGELIKFIAESLGMPPMAVFNVVTFLGHTVESSLRAGYIVGVPALGVFHGMSCGRMVFVPLEELTRAAMDGKDCALRRVRADLGEILGFPMGETQLIA